MTIRANTIVVVVICTLLFTSSGLYVQKAIGTQLQLPSFAELLESQPILAGTVAEQITTLPAFEVDDVWINSSRYTPESLRGTVTLVHFWSPTCTECLTAIPTLKQWKSTYVNSHPFQLFAVQTPEFEGQNNLDAVLAMRNEYGITYPILMDNEYKTWRAYHNRFWPSTYLFNQEGVLDTAYFGGGEEFEALESDIQRLLGISQADVDAEKQARADAAKPKELTETTFGYKEKYRFASPEGILKNSPNTYSFPNTLGINTWAVEGEWAVSAESVDLVGAYGKLRFRYNTSNLSISMEDLVGQHAVNVLLDGQPVPAGHLGATMYTEGTGETQFTIEAQSVYQLVKDLPGDHTIELHFNASTRVYANIFR